MQPTANHIAFKKLLHNTNGKTGMCVDFLKLAVAAIYEVEHKIL